MLNNFLITGYTNHVRKRILYEDIFSGVEESILFRMAY